jgi:hypothetical protein
MVVSTGPRQEIDGLRRGKTGGRWWGLGPRLQDEDDYTPVGAA